VVVQTAFLGDVVLTTPLFAALRRCFPAARLDAVVTPQAAPLVEEDPHLDGLLVYDKRGAATLPGLVRTLRAGNYGHLLAPHRSARTALMALGSGIPHRVGFSDAALAWVYHRAVRRQLDLHEVDRNLLLLEGLGVSAVAADRVLAVEYTADEAREVSACLGQAGVGEGERLVGLCAGSVWETKRWLPEGFAEVGRQFEARGFRPILLGGPEDAPLSARIAAEIGPQAVNAAGCTSLKALAAWMDRLAVVFTNDSAPLHVAAARQVPTVAVFGATTTDLGFGPFHAQSAVVEAAQPCRPCGAHGGRRCRQRHFHCMSEIAPEAVVQAGLDLLGGDKTP
jgi:heptosyltransferase-2